MERKELERTVALLRGLAMATPAGRAAFVQAGIISDGEVTVDRALEDVSIRLGQRGAIEWREGNGGNTLHDLLREANECIHRLAHELICARAVDDAVTKYREAYQRSLDGGNASGPTEAAAWADLVDAHDEYHGRVV